MFISELLTFISNIDKNVFKGKLTIGKKQIKSISSYSSNSIYYFKTMVGDDCSFEEVIMGAKAIEKQYATFVATCVGLIPFHRISQSDLGSIEEYLKLFHQNIGIDDANFSSVTRSSARLFQEAIEKTYLKHMKKDMVEITILDENYSSVNEMFTEDHIDKYSRFISNRKASNINEDAYNDLNPLNTGDTPTSYKTFDRDGPFTNTEMKKANEMIPTMIKVTVNFIIDETEEVVSRDVLIGIKASITRIKSSDLIDEFYNTIVNKRKFLKFIKFTTGEENSLSDLLFGIEEIKSDALKTNTNPWFPAFRRRLRWAKMSIPFIMKTYTANGTILMTMNAVNALKSKYGIDLMKDGNAKIIMENNFLLGFMILDQSSELVYVLYDGMESDFQEYSYNMLEREMATNDKMMRELYRTFSTR